jgi:hypothetical protein
VNLGAVGIGTATVSPSAALQMNSTGKGILINRLTTTQMNAIASPATGLLIFNTTEGAFYFYDGDWSAIGGGGGLTPPYYENGIIGVDYFDIYGGKNLTVTSDSSIYMDSRERIRIVSDSVLSLEGADIVTIKSLQVGGQIVMNAPSFSLTSTTENEFGGGLTFPIIHGDTVVCFIDSVLSLTTKSVDFTSEDFAVTVSDAFTVSGGLVINSTDTLHGFYTSTQTMELLIYQALLISSQYLNKQCLYR